MASSERNPVAGDDRASKASCSATERLEDIPFVPDFQDILEQVHDAADDVRSHAVSIREAAWRRDILWLRIHRVEFIRAAHLLAALIREAAPL
jgi:hypothetical protein